MDDDAFYALNAVYLRKIASGQVIGECTGWPAADVDPLVADLVEQDLLVDVGGMVMLNDDGTKQVLAEYAGRYATLRGDDDVEAWYQRFEVLNQQFLQTISAWQTERDGPSGDAQLTKLIRLVERQVKALAAMADRIPRYGRYATRLSAALDRIDAGETDFVTSPTQDSIHNIWFEFHEDILTVLGRPRDQAEQDHSPS